MTTMIKGLAGVVIWTDKVEGLPKIYSDDVGLVPHSVWPHFASFKWDNIRLGIGNHSDVAGTSKNPLRIMVDLRVRDIRAEHECLTKREAKFRRAPELEHWEGRICTFSDPDAVSKGPGNAVSNAWMMPARYR